MGLSDPVFCSMKGDCLVLQEGIKVVGRGEPFVVLE